MKTKFAFILLLVVLSSCAVKLSDDTVVGSWQVTNFDTDVDLAPTVIESARKIALTSKYELKQDHTFVLSDSYVPEGATGKWELNTETKEIDFYFDNGTSSEPQDYQIIEFTSSKMVLKEDIGEFGSCTYTLEK